MKKLMIAMAFVAMTASMAMAQTETKKCDKECVKAEQCDKQNCDKPCDKMQKCDARRSCEFEGLNLTDAQKTQIKAIKEEQMAKRQAACQDKQARKEAQREARQAERKEYLAKVKAVLTPEQYVQYLENAATRADKGMKRDMKKMEGRFNPKNQHRAVKAEKIDKAAKKIEKK